MRLLTTDDYVIAFVDTKNGDIKMLCKVTKVNSNIDTFECIAEHVQKANKKSILLTRVLSIDKIIANLGAKPFIGQVYGVNVEPIYKNVSLGELGEVSIYKVLGEEEALNLKKAINFIYPYMKSNFPGIFPVYLEVRQFISGSKFSKYVCNRLEKDTIENTIIIYQDSSILVKDIISSILRGFSLFLWGKFLSKQICAEWVVAYTNGIKVFHSDEKFLRGFGEELLSSGQTLNEFRNDLSEELSIIFSACLKYMKNVHGLTNNNINLILLNQLPDGTDILDYWPKHNFDIREFYNLPITELATKSPEFLFCESIEVHVTTNKKLPKSLNALLIKSLDYLKVSAKKVL